MREIYKTINEMLKSLLLTATIILIVIYYNPKNARKWMDEYNNTECDVIQKKIDLAEMEKEREQTKMVRMNWDRYNK